MVDKEIDFLRDAETKPYYNSTMFANPHLSPRHRYLLVFTLLFGGLGLILLLTLPHHCWGIVAMLAAGLASAWLVALLGERSLRRRLHRLREEADALGRGEFGRHVTCAPKDDFIKLAESLDRITEQLKAKCREEDRLRRQLTRSEKLALIGELAAVVAHEINNPLDGLQNCTRIIRRNRDNPEQMMQLLDLMDAGLYRIEMIVRRLLSMSRDEPVHLTPTRLDDVVNDAVLFVQPRLDRHHIELVRRFPDTPLMAMVDRVQMAQVFINLAINAADSMLDGGRLEFAGRVGEHGRTVLLDVIDTGIGIEPNVLPNIFDPFYTTKDMGLGSGLGLSVVKRIIDAHQGKIEVTSEAGRGTCFHIELPAAVEVETPTALPKGMPQSTMQKTPSPA